MKTGKAWDHVVRMRPARQQLAELIRTHGMNAAQQRWGWLSYEALRLILKKGTMDPDQAPDDFEVEDIEP
jgi:hypothetical protein